MWTQGQTAIEERRCEDQLSTGHRGSLGHILLSQPSEGAHLAGRPRTPELGDSEFLWFKPPALWYFVMIANEPEPYS